MAIKSVIGNRWAAVGKKQPLIGVYQGGGDSLARFVHTAMDPRLEVLATDPRTLRSSK